MSIYFRCLKCKHFMVESIQLEVDNPRLNRLNRGLFPAQSAGVSEDLDHCKG